MCVEVPWGSDAQAAGTESRCSQGLEHDEKETDRQEKRGVSIPVYLKLRVVIQHKDDGKARW